MLPLLKIRYNPYFCASQFFIAVLLLSLALYTDNWLQALLALILLTMSFRNWRGGILELYEEEIWIKNGLGIVLKKVSFKNEPIEIRADKIIINNKTIYKHSFMFVRPDFDEVKAFLAAQNPNNNLQRHLITDD
jgi:hypothetical protein